MGNKIVAQMAVALFFETALGATRVGFGKAVIIAGE
jgi:hypothetical protein